MTVYTYNGSIPTEIPGGVSEADHIAAGWKIAPDKPECPEGKEVVWLNWEWVIRDPKPENNEGHVWKWNHDQMMWLEYELPVRVVEEIPALSSTSIEGLTTTSLSGLTSTSIAALTSTSIPSL
jgi:hypothetical protein